MKEFLFPFKQAPLGIACPVLLPVEFVRNFPPSLHPLRVSMIRRSGAATAQAAASPPPDSRVLIAHFGVRENYSIIGSLGLDSNGDQSPEDNDWAVPSQDIGSGADTEWVLLHLRHPKTGAKACYIVTNDNIQEIHWFKEPFSSWFLGDHVLEDGSLYMCTPVDPIFLLLPLLDEARMKRADDAGKFRSLEEILYVEGYPGYLSISSSLGNALDAVCEVRDVGASKFYRLDDSKVLAWLCCKVNYTMKGLDALEGYDKMLPEAKEAHAVGLLGDYLKDSPWLDMLCEHLGIDLHASKKAQSWAICESDFIPEPKPHPGKREEKGSTGKGKASKKGSIVGMRKVTQFFAMER